MKQGLVAVGFVFGLALALSAEAVNPNPIIPFDPPGGAVDCYKCKWQPGLPVYCGSVPAEHGAREECTVECGGGGCYCYTSGWPPYSCSGGGSGSMLPQPLPSVESEVFAFLGDEPLVQGLLAFFFSGSRPTRFGEGSGIAVMGPNQANDVVAHRFDARFEPVGVNGATFEIRFEQHPVYDVVEGVLYGLPSGTDLSLQISYVDGTNRVEVASF